MKKYLLIIALLAGALNYDSFAQVGFKTSLLAPRGDLGPTFKKGAAFELFYVTDYFSGHVRSRLGIFHSDLAPRLDTFPTYVVKSSNSTTILPGYAVYEKLRINCLFIDQNIRLFNIKQFSAYAGVGLMVGFAKLSYVREIETLISETVERDNTIGGLRTNIHAVYTIGNHVQVFAEAMHNAMVVTDWSTSYSHNTYGIGINYRFKSN